MTPRIRLTGRTGQVGSELLRLLPEIGEVVALDRHELDLLTPESIRRTVREMRPDLIINAAAFTPVDAAETQEAGKTTWYDFVCAILQEAPHLSPAVSWFAEATKGRPLITRRVVPITTAEYSTTASRPVYSVLSNSRLDQTFGIRLPDWHTQLRLVFEIK